MLQLTDAPTMINWIRARSAVRKLQDVIEFLEKHRTSAVGIAGREESEKARSALDKIRIGAEVDRSLSTGACQYNTVDFVRTIFTMTAKEVIQKYSPVLREGPLIGLIQPFRKSSADHQIGQLSQQALDSIMGSRSDQRTATTGIAGKGIALQRGRQFTWTQRERSHPELIAEFKEYLEQYRLSGGRPIVIAIDELDKLAEASEAVAAINGLKDLFHTSKTRIS